MALSARAAALLERSQGYLQADSLRQATGTHRDGGRSWWRREVTNEPTSLSLESPDPQIVHADCPVAFLICGSANPDSPGGETIAICSPDKHTVDK